MVLTSFFTSLQQIKATTDAVAHRGDLLDYIIITCQVGANVSHLSHTNLFALLYSISSLAELL
jgi:hypothetical protein